LAGTRYRTVGKSMYTDDSKITDHYAIIPTGQGLSALGSLKGLGYPVYELIARRFLAIFYPPAQYEKVSAEFVRKDEHFFAGVRILKDPGYLKVLGKDPSDGGAKAARGPKDAGQEAQVPDEEAEAFLKALRKGDRVDVSSLMIREGETTPPKRYTSGSLILAMENAGHLIEDEELRAQIKGSGIGTSATRAEILKKLKTIDYIKINGKSQAVTPSLQGELVYDVVDASMTQLLNPELTASWEKGLSMVADGQIGPDEYMEKLSAFVVKRTDRVKGIGHPEGIRARFRETEKFYRQGAAKD
ncbi:MAG: type IA DNA topoisomerase, partial [Lachnospiraceae bacterium]|nr:type IA DNA topoisomerase [Lachnospiraceae bacterium]